MPTFDEAYKSRPMLFGTEATAELLNAVKQYGIAGTALELGCGDGRDTYHILKRGFAVTAVDDSHYAVKHLLERPEIQAYLPERLHAYTADLLRDPFEKIRYDLVYSITVLDNFLPQVQDTLVLRMMQAVKDGGYLFLTVHTEEDDGFHSPGHGSEFAAAVQHYFRQNELLHRFGGLGQVLSYQEEVEEDLAHGDPHFHGFAHLLLQKTERE